jgi:hypothetical protein
VQDELKRLKIERPELRERIRDRVQARDDYFVRQYEHLLIAVAHECVPPTAGVCTKCGLYGSDRVHMRHYVELHNAGYEPAMKHLLEFDK